MTNQQTKEKYFIILHKHLNNVQSTEHLKPNQNVKRIGLSITASYQAQKRIYVQYKKFMKVNKVTE